MAGAINSKLYVTTPDNGFSGFSNYLDVYDPASNTWTSLPGSSAAHGSGAGGVINGKLYVAGGDDASGHLQTLTEVYDPYTNTWTTLAPMIKGVSTPASAVINGKLYVFGGSNGTRDITTVQVYDPITNTWSSTRPVVPIAANNFASDVLYGIAFVVGGSSAAGTLLDTNYLYLEPPSIP